MIIAQLSDVHARPRGRKAYGDVDTNAMLEQAVATLRRLPTAPDCVVVTGDLTDCGLPEEYATLRECLAPLRGIPIYVIPGNHDRREALVQGLVEGHDYLPRNEPYLQYVVDHFAVRLIALDSVIAGRTEGELCPRRLRWLEQHLDRDPHRPTMVFVHHPPFLTGITSMDALGLCAGRDEFAAIVARYPSIERVVAGHYHRPITVRWAGTVGYAAPSTAHQVVLDLRPGEPTRFVLEPPGLALHVWSELTGVVTHAMTIGDFGSPFDVTLEAEYPGSDDARSRPVA